jgi:hypothetical protein
MSTHEDFGRRSIEKTSSDRAFGLVFTVFFALVAFWPLLHRGRLRGWALAVAVVFLLLALLRPALLHPLNRAWTRLGLLLHRIVTPVITGFIFFMVVTPIGVLHRLTAKDPLRLRFDAQADTYWIPRTPPGPDPATMVNQF